MIERVTITSFDIARAEEKSHEMGNLPGSIRNGTGNVYGFVGEFLVAERIGARIENTYHYDMIKDGWLIDAKTKVCTSKPHDNYECSIAAHNTRQRCHFYVFVRILEDFSVGWILGAIRKPEYFRRARFCRQGTPDSNGWTFKADCFNLSIKCLHPLKAR